MSGSEFAGNIAHTLDAKGRATIPAAYRKALGSGFTISINSRCTAAAFYPKALWDEMRESFSQIPVTDDDGMGYVFMMQGNAFPDCDIDAQGRVLIPPTLRELVGLTKDVRFVGVGSCLELWDEAAFTAMQTELRRNFSRLTGHVNAFLSNQAENHGAGGGEK